MTKRTTDQWAELLAAATPGPWVRSENPWEPHDVRTVDQERWIAMTKDESEGLDRDALADTYLIAAAPEAVVEVVRLRRALEQLRDDYRTRPYPYGEVARDLTRILEGHNDE